MTRLLLIASLGLASVACGDTDSIEHGADAGECVPETDAQICDDLGLTCGPAQADDRCGTLRSVDCGVCDYDARCRSACNVPGGAQNCTAVDFNSCVDQCKLETSDVTETCGDCIVEHTEMNEVLGACTITSGTDDPACHDLCETTTDFFTATVGTTEMCALGWTTSAATADGVEVSIQGDCTGSYIGVWFKPVPAPGSSASCDRLQSNMTNFCHAGSADFPVTGTVTVSGTQGAYRVDGTCACPADDATVEFSLPLTVE